MNDKTLKTLIGIFLFILFFTFYFGMCVDVHAAEIKVAWDANDPVPEGYKVFIRQPPAAYDYSTPAWQGSGTLTDPIAVENNVPIAIVVRAFDGELQSPDSDEIQYTPREQKTILYPEQPKSILIIFK